MGWNSDKLLQMISDKLLQNFSCHGNQESSTVIIIEATWEILTVFDL